MDGKMLIMALIGIAFDIITGFLKAGYLKEINSTSLREGLYHKMTEIIILSGGLLLDHATGYVGLDFDMNVFPWLALYILITEIISILENLCEVNEELRKILSPYLRKLQRKKEALEDGDAGDIQSITGRGL